MIKTSDIVVGANAGRARSHNRQVILDRIRTAGRIGRADIARSTGLSTQAVSNIIADLLSDRMIAEQGRQVVGRGLPAVQYALNAKGGFALGVEIRPDAVFSALLNLCGDKVASERMSLRANDRNAVTEAVRTLRDTLLKASKTPKNRLLGAGIVMPGPFGETGIRDGETELPIWADVAPDRWLSKALELPVVIENDANAAAIAERIVGTASGLKTYAYIYFGNGIGLGAVHGARLIAGAYGNAGEIGHIPVPAAGKSMPLESMVSRMSLIRALGKEGIAAESVDDLDRLYAAKTQVLMAWLENAQKPLEAAISIVENLFDPEAVILGGAMPDSILDHLIRSLTLPDKSVSNREDRTGPRLLRGTSGRMTATLGAAALVINQTFTPKIAAQA
ncbi:MAG: ROK family transcriptional regulator [Pseudomonadota bacterium]